MEVQQAISELRDMSFVLCHPIDGDGRLITEQLARLGIVFQQEWPPTLGRVTSSDIVMLSLIPETVSKFGSSFIKEFKNKIVISVLGYENPTVLSAACALNSSALLFSPVKPFGVLSSIVFAVAQNKIRVDMSRRITKLEGRLESVRLIEQAKRFLIDSENLSEEDAFALLRKNAMEKRVSIEEIAQSVVAARETLTSILGISTLSGHKNKNTIGLSDSIFNTSIRRVK